MFSLSLIKQNYLICCSWCCLGRLSYSTRNLKWCARTILIVKSKFIDGLNSKCLLQLGQLGQLVRPVGQLRRPMQLLQHLRIFLKRVKFFKLLIYQYTKLSLQSFVTWSGSIVNVGLSSISASSRCQSTSFHLRSRKMIIKVSYIKQICLQPS